MLNSHKKTVALAGKSKYTYKNNSQSYVPDDTKRIRNKCNGNNGRNFMPSRVMSALLLIILCAVLKNECTYANEAALRRNASRQLSEMKDYSKGYKDNKCKRNDRYCFPDEQFHNMREDGMAHRGRESRIKMSSHEEWDGERGLHHPRNRDMNMGMHRDVEHDRRRSRYRDDVDEEMDMERADRRRNRNRGEMDEEMERYNRRRRDKGRDMNRDDGDYMYERGREMYLGRDIDEMGRRRYREEMDTRTRRDAMGPGRDRDEIGRGRDRDDMGPGRDRYEMGPGRDREEIGRGRDRDEMGPGRDRYEMGPGRHRDDMGPGRENARQELDHGNKQEPEMPVKLGREVGRILPRGDMALELERRRKGTGGDMDEEVDRDEGKREKEKSTDVESGMNKRPSENKNMPPVSDVKELDTTNSTDINFHVTESEIAQMIDELQDYVKVDDMFLLFNFVNNNEKNKYIKMQLGVVRMCETLAQYYKIPHHYKTRQWAKSYHGMTEQLLHNEKKSYNKLCTFVQNGNSSHVAFVEFLNELVGIWTSCTKEMEKYWKSYLTNKFKVYWETKNVDV
ncbi:hypothetical protein AK88_00707 [Plasmodium fragile]|uniref:Plasmodium RESA N-terminal domain-containing protein n=1 Tax=Plasmodium fragile TaxID=5857 RepID=A0A0D9QRB7_PLAFR|nr:uncharacterized protein AK88_00707 [Plasmodium fragile]KJP89498.1 hypothetical protein AK88_00707 [Plasmodium fragile]